VVPYSLALISHLFIQNIEGRTICNTDMNKQMPDGLAELGPSTSDAGRLGILLIVISYPGEPDQSGQIGSQWAHPDHC